MLRIWLGCTFILNVFACIGQTYNYRHFTPENGLAGSNVYVAVQDSKGYMWFGTDEGVSRYDGKTFITYTTEDGLSDNDILRIMEDKYGRIWFLSFNGHLSFYSLNDDKIHNENTDPYLAKAYVGSGFYYAIEDSKNRIWFCTLSGQLVILHEKDIQKITLSTITTQGIACVEEDNDKNIFFYFGANKYKLNERTFTAELIQNDLPPSFSTYYKAASGAIFYTSLEGLWKLKNGKINKIEGHFLDGLEPTDIVTTTDDGNWLYVCTRHHGVIAIETGMSTEIKYPFKNNVNTVTIDNENNLWFMTRGAGVYMLPSQARTATFYPLNNFNDEEIYCIGQQDSNVFWVGGIENKCYRIANSTIENYYLPSVFPGRTINFEKDKEGSMWACTEGGIYKFNKSENSKPGKLIVPPGFDGLRFLNVSFNSKNEGVFSLATCIGKVVTNKRHIVKCIAPIHDKTENKRTYFTFYDNTDRLFVANIDGLNEVKGDKLINYGLRDSLLRSRITFISQVSDSTLLLATDGHGIVFFKDNEVKMQLTSKNGLAPGVCRKVITSNDSVYACTNKGLSFFYYHKNTISSFYTYTVYNGLASNDVRDVVKWGNTLYVVTSKGLSILKLQETEKEKQPPPVYITSIVDINNKALNKNGFDLTYSNNFLKVTYNAIYFSNPGEITYQYNFNNDTSKWITTGNSEIVFSDLTEGHYKFAVRAKKLNSTWSESATFEFTVLPPFYRTWWFYALIIATCTIGVSLAIIYILRRNRRSLIQMIERKNALNLERNRISADMHDDVGSDLSKISITSEFIKAQLNNHHTLYGQLEKINEFAGGARKKMDDIIWALNPENDNLGNLVAYINTYGLNYFADTSISFELINLTENQTVQFNAKERRNIFLIVKELCTNALKHSQAHSFKMTVYKDNGYVIFKTEDDGIGMMQLTASTRKNGLLNMKRRAEEIKALFEIVDVDKGTCYRLSVTINN